jgi:hypothetical protein
MAISTNNVLYWSGTMLDSDSSVDPQIVQTYQSGITTVLLWSLHVTDDGSLAWNNGPPKGYYLVQNSQFDPSGVFTKLATRLNTLLTSGTVTKVFFSIGAGGTSDFTNIENLLRTSNGTETLTTNFQALVAALNVGGNQLITGFDFDDEDNFDVATILTFTSLLSQKCNAIITYCPYNPSAYGSFWESCLERVYQAHGKQLVSWMNAQAYSGGSPGDITQWVQLIQQNQSKNGVSNPNAFIVPGLAAMNNQGDGPGLCPPQFCSQFSQWQGIVPGGFIWNSQHVFNDGTGLCSGQTATMSQYAQAINNGINGDCNS